MSCCVILYQYMCAFNGTENIERPLELSSLIEDHIVYQLFHVEQETCVFPCHFPFLKSLMCKVMWS